MPGMWQKTMVYLGLKDDEEGYEYDYDELSLDEEPVEPPTSATSARNGSRRRRHRDARARRRRRRAAPGARRARRRGPTGARLRRRPQIRPMPAELGARVHVVEPHGFNDAQEVGDRLKADQPVIINLQGLSRDLQRRMIDFSSGLTYAVGGSMSRVADQVFLLTPSNVEVSQEEKERLQARGLFRA